MRIDLQPTDALSAVTFMQDYLQLAFQDCIFSLYNIVSYEFDGLRIEQGQEGFCDVLVALIGQTVTTRFDDATQLVFRFSNGAFIRVQSSGKHVRGPEAWQLTRAGLPQVVHPNM
jgi:hypothetical protein